MKKWCLLFHKVNRAFILAEHSNTLVAHIEGQCHLHNSCDYVNSDV